ncbi:MAG: hypothetical protein R6V07_00330 [Armatimonadota bacterium]
MTEYNVTGIKVGNVEEFRWRFMDALVGLELSLRVGDRVQIVGPETDFRQTIDEIRVDREKVKRGKSAQKVWIPVAEHVRPGDAVVVLPSDDGTGDASATGRTQRGM